MNSSKIAIFAALLAITNVSPAHAADLGKSRNAEITVSAPYDTGSRLWDGLYAGAGLGVDIGGGQTTDAMFLGRLGYTKQVWGDWVVGAQIDAGTSQNTDYTVGMGVQLGYLVQRNVEVYAIAKHDWLKLSLDADSIHAIEVGGGVRLALDERWKVGVEVTKVVFDDSRENNRAMLTLSRNF